MSQVVFWLATVVLYSLPFLSQMQARYDKVRAASLHTVSPSSQQITSADILSKRPKLVRFSVDHEGITP